MTLRLNGDSSGFTEIKAADNAGDNSIKLPASNGSANQLLQNGGTAGELQYTSAGDGLHYDSSGRLLVGVSTARTNLFNNPTDYGGRILFEGDDATGAGRAGLAVIQNIPTEDPAFIVLGRSKGSSTGSNVALDGDGQWAGMISFQGSDGTNFLELAQIASYTDGTPSTGVMPGDLVFRTNGGTSSTSDRVAIGSNGALKLLAGCPGIDFSATNSHGAGMTSEVLDSYEEGTWTPSFTNAGNATYAVQAGTYIKVGNLVTVQLFVQFASAGTAAGNVAVAGLPFVTKNTSNLYAVSSSFHGTGWSVTRNSMNVLVPPGQTTSNVFYYNMASQGATYGMVQHSDLGTGNTLISFTYYAN